MIDADPQCNSTIYCFTNELFTEVYYEKKGFTIYDVIKSVNHGIGYANNIKKYYINNFGYYFIAGDDEYKRIIRENRNLEIITYNAKNNHQELHDALDELVSLVDDERTIISNEMDW